MEIKNMNKMNNSASWIWCNFFLFYVLQYFLYFLLCSSYFQGKPMGAMSTFTMGNYPHQPVSVYLFVKSVNLSFMLEFKSAVIKEVSSAKMSHSFVAAKVLMKRTFCTFSPFFLLMGSQRCSMFPLELVME